MTDGSCIHFYIGLQLHRNPTRQTEIKLFKHLHPLICFSCFPFKAIMSHFIGSPTCMLCSVKLMQAVMQFILSLPMFQHFLFHLGSVHTVNQPVMHFHVEDEKQNVTAFIISNKLLLSCKNIMARFVMFFLVLLRLNNP